MQKQIKIGSTDKSVVVRIVTASSGTPVTNVVSTTTGLGMYYRREGGSRAGLSVINLAAQDSAHSDGGIIHIDDGYYRFDPPDAAWGASDVLIGGSCTNNVVIGAYVQLVGNDLITDFTTARLARIDDNITSRPALSQIRSEVSVALSAIGLDHLLASQVSDVGDVTTNSIFGKIAASSGEWNQFSASAHSLQANRIKLNTLDSVPLSAIRSEVNVALSAIGLDHLISSAVNFGDVASNSMFAYLAASTTPAVWSEFNNTTDSLEAIRDRGDSAWITAVGFSTLTQAQVRTQVDEGLSVIHLDHLIASSVHDTGVVATNSIIGKLSTSAGEWNQFSASAHSLQAIRIKLNTADFVPLSAIRSEVNVALSSIGLDHLISASAVQADVADGSLFGQLGGSAGDWGTFQSLTDSLESIRNKADDIETDTINLQSRIPTALVAGRMLSDADAIAGSASAASQIRRSALTIVNGAAAAGTLTTTCMTTNLGEATNDHFVGRIIIWTSGALSAQGASISAYNGTTKLLSYSAITEAPAENDEFVIL